MPFHLNAKHVKGGAIALGAGLCAVALGAWGSPPNIINPHGYVARTESNLFWIILGIATFIFVAVMTAFIFSIIRYRARPGAPEPRQIHGNNALELAWTITPTVVLVAVLGVTLYTLLNAIQQPTNVPTLTVTAVGHQWWWEFDYPNQHIITADELHVPVNMVVHVDLVSNDVIHSFWIPDLAGKTDVIPGHDNFMWFKSNTPGAYRGECAEFCGTQHAHMDFEVVVQSQAAYNTWVSAQQKPAAKPTSALAIAGEKYFATGQCAGCHVINGINSGKLIGPNLTHFGSRQLIAGGVLDNNPQNLATWLHNPQAVKDGSDMPNLHLSQQEIDELVAYLESLK
ncbi:MAG TPA: cytochrome c oxidase subunit II [Ktedonobacterales bacterium]|nr:cytochrome c oxidase subunit II [Ktedonobacterales bacterium]